MGKNNRSKKIDKQRLKLRRKKTAKCHPKVSHDMSKNEDIERKELHSCLDESDVQNLIGEWNRQNKEKIQFRKKDMTGSLLR